MNPREKAKAILAAIIEAAGGNFNGNVRLYKAFYLAHILHFRNHQGLLSDYPIVRMPLGPAVDAGQALFNELQQEGVLQLGQLSTGQGNPESIFILLKPIKGLSAEEIDSVRRAVTFIADKSGKELSDLTHGVSKTWKDTSNGRTMNVYADLLSNQEYAEMKQRHRQVGELVDAIFA